MTTFSSSFISASISNDLLSAVNGHTIHMTDIWLEELQIIHYQVTELHKGRITAANLTVHECALQIQDTLLKLITEQLK